MWPCLAGTHTSAGEAGRGGEGAGAPGRAGHVDTAGLGGGGEAVGGSQLGPGGLGLTALSPLPREPDSTYFDLPQSSQGSGGEAGGTEASMGVFHLQGVASPSVMVSGAALSGGLGAGWRGPVSRPGGLQSQQAGRWRTTFSVALSGCFSCSTKHIGYVSPGAGGIQAWLGPGALTVALPPWGGFVLRRPVRTW